MWRLGSPYPLCWLTRAVERRDRHAELLRQCDEILGAALLAAGASKLRASGYDD